MGIRDIFNDLGYEPLSIDDEKDRLRLFVKLVYHYNDILRAYIDVFVPKKKVDENDPEKQEKCTIPSARAFLLWNCSAVKKIRLECQQEIEQNLNISKQDSINMILSLMLEAEEIGGEKNRKIRLECLKELCKLEGLYEPIKHQHDMTLQEILKQGDIVDG